MNKYRVFIKTYILLFFCLICILFLVNYFIDISGHFFNSKKTKRVAKALVDKKNIFNLINFDERILQKYIIEEKSIPYDTVIIGSSRVMGIGVDQIDSKSLFNHSVSGATIEDLYAIIGLYISKNKFPKKIIIGIDSWIFNNSMKEEKRYLSLLDSYNLAVDIITNKKKYINNDLPIINKYLFSYMYAKENIKSIFNNKEEIEVSKDLNNNGYIKKFDGTLIYPTTIGSRPAIFVNNIVNDFIKGTISRHENFLTIDNQVLFQSMLIYLKRKKIDIELVLTPYHPVLYRFFKVNKKYNVVLKVEKYINKVAKDYNIKLNGSFDPKFNNFIESDFQDELHLKNTALNKLLKVKNEDISDR